MVIVREQKIQSHDWFHGHITFFAGCFFALVIAVVFFSFLLVLFPMNNAIDISEKTINASKTVQVAVTGTTVSPEKYELVSGKREHGLLQYFTVFINKISHRPLNCRGNFAS